MKILFLTTGPDIVASSRARVYQYLPYLHKVGFRSLVIPVTCRRQAYKIINKLKLSPDERIYGKIYSYISILLFILLSSFFDILFIQKVILPAALIKAIRLINPAIVVDFDDAVFLRQEAVSGLLPAQNQRSASFLRYASHVIVSNDFLKSRLSGVPCGSVYVLNTPVDTARFSGAIKKDPRGRMVIGWIGSAETSVYLRDLKDVFETLSRKYSGLRFEFVGADDFYKGLEGYTIKEWSFAREPQDLQGFDVGIMPLRNDDWCRGKAGYKLIQYMAAGVASIASPVGINKEIVTDGVNGFLAATSQDWLEKFCLLIDDAGLRKRLGTSGRKTAQESYSYEVNSPKLADILRSVAKK